MNEKGKYFMSFYHTLEEILFIEPLTETMLVIGVYNDLDRFYEKHVVMKRKDGGFIWEYPFYAYKLNRGFFMIQRENQTVFPLKIYQHFFNHCMNSCLSKKFHLRLSNYFFKFKANKLELGKKYW